MRMTQLLGRRERAQDHQDEIASHRLLLRAGYVRQHAAGIYSYLNLGLRSLRKIEAIVREEVNRSGAQEILMSVVHSADVWKATGRYEEVDQTLLRFADRRGRAMVLAMTHEEIIAELALSDIRSYRDANLVVYQIQTKFRDELRTRGGLLRTREFLMKDAYSLHMTEAGMLQAYEEQSEAYNRIFRRLGLRDVHRIRSDTGDMGGTVAHEYMCLLEVGEDTVAFCDQCDDAWNSEVAGGDACHSCEGQVRLRRGVEVGNIFQLGTRYTDALGVKATGRDGQLHSVVMGSYGIGISRLLATLVEQNHDDRGIALTAATACFDVHIVVLNDSHKLRATASYIYNRSRSAGLDVLWDDRGVGAGEQLADADLIGAAIRVTLGTSTLKDQTVELTERRTGKTQVVGVDDAVKALQDLVTNLLQRERDAAS